jgi:hypothetical protein
VEALLDVHLKSVKNKKFFDPNVVTMYLLHKGFMEKYICLFAHGEPYALYETMVEMIVGSISSSSSVHGVADDNSNPYRNMIMDVMRMN